MSALLQDGLADGTVGRNIILTFEAGSCRSTEQQSEENWVREFEDQNC
jgi:hypothetical protein